MKLEKLDHLHFYVKDLEKTMESFEELLGVKFSGIMNWEESGGIRDSYAPPGLNVIQSIGNRAIDKFIDHKDEGISGVSFKVSNIDEAINELQSKGLKLIAKVKAGDVTEALFAPPDFFGVILELCEYPGDDIHAAATVDDG